MTTSFHPKTYNFRTLNLHFRYICLKTNIVLCTPSVTQPTSLTVYLENYGEYLIWNQALQYRLFNKMAEKCYN